MLCMASSENAPAAVPAHFATTNWSMVIAAGDLSSPQSRQALATLCQGYWYPLYAYVRRQGHSGEQALDLTQEFFLRFLEKDFLRSVDRGKGRFRSFLLAACKHFLANERDRALAQKRGGGISVVTIDAGAAEQRYLLEPAHTSTTEKLFERRWAMTLLEQVLARLRDEFAADGKSRSFDTLKAFLTGERTVIRYAQAAEELGMTEGAVKVAVHRLRHRYRELLREEISRTLQDPSQVEDEIRDLFAALGP
jgi:DNA-directed RNA polymerase specialized sigma24 family protein